jgi:hypothetical protein
VIKISRSERMSGEAPCRALIPGGFLDDSVLPLSHGALAMKNPISLGVRLDNRSGDQERFICAPAIKIADELRF